MEGRARVTAAVLAALGVRDAVAWGPILDTACARHGILAPRPVATFLANALHDSAGLAWLEESLNYSVAALLARFGPQRIDAATAQRLGRTPSRPADPEGIANAVYGGTWGSTVLGNQAPGDGWQFRGRGLLQVTGRANYLRLSQLTGQPVETLLTMLPTETGAADIGARFFAATGCITLAEREDMATVRRRLSGGTAGLALIRVLYADAKALLGG